MENVVIKLSNSRNAKVFDTNSLIHSREFADTKKWIDDRISFAKENKFDKKERLHDTITILGSRGSGKTTFLYSLISSYQENNDVEVIDIIDPTLIEEKGHVFLTIISQIENAVEKVLSKSDCNPESESYRKKKDWRDKLKSLAAGLPSIDGIGGTYENWQDPEFIMDKGLRSVRAAKNLEADFHELLKLGLEILEKKAFIIALDDIDIDFRKGWPVLETIRKYLTSPYIVTILSGDLKLFSKAIRKQQWKNFGKALMINEGEKLDRIRDYDDLVTEMEGQYLQKVMQPQRRIHLTTIQEKINIGGKENIGIFILSKKEKEGVEGREIENVRIDKYYDTILAKFGIHNPYQAEAYRSFLLRLPIRTQIQFLSEFEDISNVKEANVTDAFLSDLYEKRVDIDMAKANNKYLNLVILRLLINEETLNGGYQLQPTTTDQSLNSSLFSLSLIFSQNTINNPHLIFDYFIRIGYVRNLLSVLGHQDDKNTRSFKKSSIEGLCQYSGLFKDNVLRDVGCYITAYLQAALISDKDRKNSSWGMIKLPGRKTTLNKIKDAISWRIDDVFKNATEQERSIAFFPLSFSKDKNGNGYPIYSIYVLLATIGELIRKIQERDTEKGILELSQVRSYPMPLFDEVLSIDASDIELPYMKSTGNESVLKNELEKWVKRYPNNMCISPHLLGKISTRLFYSLGNIEGKGKSDDLGQSMHIRIVMLMNSILVEDAKENIGEVDELNINNPNYSSKIFIDNLKAVGRLKNTTNKYVNLSFSKWMLSCPLFLLYLNPNDEGQHSRLIDVLASFLENEKFDVNKILKYSIFEKLTQVKYQDPNNKSQPKAAVTIVSSSLLLPMFRSTKESERKKVIGILKANKIPHEWFENRKNQQERQSLNKLIRNRTTHLFKEGEEKKKLESSWIRKFRLYLEKNKITW